MSFSSLYKCIIRVAAPRSCITRAGSKRDISLSTFVANARPVGWVSLKEARGYTLVILSQEGLYSVAVVMHSAPMHRAPARCGMRDQREVPGEVPRGYGRVGKRGRE